MQINVGAGELVFIPPASATDLTPVRFGVLQDVTLEYSSSKKFLMGQNQFPVASADVDAKLTGKAKFAQFRGALLAAALAGATQGTGSVQEVTEPGTVAAGAVTVTGSATFATDLGVVDSTGTPFKKVASAPAVLQYSVAAGVYTFNVGDNGKVLTFRYTKTAVGGITVTVGNQPMQISTTYKAEFFNYTPQNASKTLAAELFAIVIPKFSFAFKNSDFSMQDVDFEALDDGSGNVAKFYTTE
jgi:hypothetical protein